MQTKHKIYNPEMECIDREELRKIQGERLKNVVAHTYNNVPLFRKRMDEKGVKPEDIHSVDDIVLLPFTEKRSCTHSGLVRHNRKADCFGVYTARH